MPDDDFSTERHDCRPDFKEMDGWCVTLFPLVDDKGVFKFDKCLSTDHRDAEISRVSFKYIRKYPDGSEKEFPMELWSGVIGVAEEEATFALTPQIGWFIRKSQEKEESIERLREADKHSGIWLSTDNEVPVILKELGKIHSLQLSFDGNVVIPDWLLKMDIDHLVLEGFINKRTMAALDTKFTNKNCFSNEYHEWYK